MLAEEQYKRHVAYKLIIGDIMKAKPIMSEENPEQNKPEDKSATEGGNSGNASTSSSGFTGKKLLFLELGDKKIVRVHLVANVVDKFDSDGEKKFSSITLDDASGQIRVKAFGDDVSLLKEISQGDTLRLIGNVREYNNEFYILPEIVKKIDPRWLLVRKLEIQNSRKDIPLAGDAALKDIILDKIKNSDGEGGVDVDKIIMETEASPDLINSEIKKLLEEGLIYEPRPGKLRYLG
jgi:hypothetical protein